MKRLKDILSKGGEKDTYSVTKETKKGKKEKSISEKAYERKKKRYKKKGGSTSMSANQNLKTGETSYTGTTKKKSGKKSVSKSVKMNLSGSRQKRFDEFNKETDSQNKEWYRKSKGGK